jgi:ADP-ribose pyrophosphatase YjhB (NUDIX family)
MKSQIDKFEKSIKKPLRKVTLLFLVKDKKILLAMKKRGFGKGRWNGVGGKQNEGEKIEETAVREAREEIGVEPKEFKKVAVLNFYFPHNQDWNQQIITYFCSTWHGRPKESEEMNPEWFEKNKLPFNKMWQDDPLWLPHVICGKTIHACFLFAEDDKMIDYKIKVENAKI